MNQTLLFANRLQALRNEIQKRELDGLLVPMTDEYQNEYVPACARRIEYLTGFTGSYAFLVILSDEAAFFTDSRYTLQAAQQVSSDLFTLFDVSQKTPLEWLETFLKPSMKIGFDPTLHTEQQIERIEIALLKKNTGLAPTEENLIDLIWTDRPQPTITPAVAHDIVYAGKPSEEKRREIAALLQDKGFHAAVLTDPASIAWLLNVRGGDVPMTPLPLSSAILRVDGTMEWFLDARKVSKGLDKHLGGDVSRYDETDFQGALKRLGEARCRVLIDPARTSHQIFSILRLSGAAVEKGDDLCLLPRACKNLTELDGMRSAHRRDGAALVKFLAWIDKKAGNRFTELEAEEQLEAFRAEGALYQGPSFETIAGAGPHGAIVHYRATKETNESVRPGSFFLVDSGGQYLDGTTDVTRTIPIGDISSEMKDRYTRVLKGMIALSSIRFPKGTSGMELDVLARQFLWAEGLDYGHGTGHGVGSYLSVHEGPQSISRRGEASLAPGMVLSNEPGYYKARHYGIRLENLQYVVELFDISEPDHKMYGFEVLTLAPFDRRAIVADMLTKGERCWLNAYHARVLKALCPQLDQKTGDWLKMATIEI